MDQKIVFFEIEEWEKEYVQKSLGGEGIIFTPEKLSLSNCNQYKDATIISPFIYSSVQKEVLEQFSALSCVATRSTGYDHIDINFCKEKLIAVSNVPSYGAHTVAEHTFALILALSRNIVLSAERTKRADFSLDGIRGFDLFGKTIGVVGTGNIGKRVAQIALGFGMRVVAFNRSKDAELVTQGVSYVALDELLSTSDIVTLHIPHNESTHHLVNMESIYTFKKGSILINTSRGPLVETQAVLEGIEKGILGAAGLDVLEEECTLKEERELLTSDFLKSCDIRTQLLNHVLLNKQNVLVTPHNAFNSKEALIQILDITIANIKSYLQKTPENLVI